MASSCNDYGWMWPDDPSRRRSLALSLALWSSSWPSPLRPRT
jgi:hypothetical protein